MATKRRDLIDFCKNLFTTSNIVASDIKNVIAERIETEFSQDSAGVKIIFTVSNHFIGKAKPGVHEPLERMLKDRY